MSSCLLSTPSFSQARRDRAQQRRIADLPAPDEADARPAVDGAEAACGPAHKKQRRAPVPAGFALRRGLHQTMIQTGAVEAAECKAYLEAVQDWWDTVHKAWKTKCDRRKARYNRLKYANERDRLPAPDPPVLPAEPPCSVPKPACVQAYVVELNALPVAARAEACRTGGGEGHTALDIARKLVLGEQRLLFEASDKALAAERKATMDAAAAAARAKAHIIGPNGETDEDYDVEHEKAKGGGKGQLVSTPHLRKKRDRDDEFQ